jgi:AcrR family transcriptional regulator
MQQYRSRDRASDRTGAQRERLLTGMLAAVNADGYTGATVANVITRARVSRTTFYEYFTDKDDCFLALYRDIAQAVLDQISDAVKRSPPERIVSIVVGQLINHAEVEPVQARFLFSDALAAGPRALKERGRMIGRISGWAQTTHSSACAQTPAPDLPMQAVIGATQWLIAQRFRRGERQLTQLARELAQWLTFYERPIGKHQWSSPGPVPLPEHCLDLSNLADELPSLLRSAGSTRISSDSPDRRSRILLASAESAVQNGYEASTVGAIMARAELRNAAFYDHFADKRQAFQVVHELAFRGGMGVGAAAYFSVPCWPERVWRCLLATSQFYAADAAMAHVALAETHALGVSVIQRVEETRSAFTTLLRDDRQNTSPLPDQTAAEAIGAAIFEIAHDLVLNRRAKDLPRYAYDSTYLALAPFLGVLAANRFVQRKLKEVA